MTARTGTAASARHRRAILVPGVLAAVGLAATAAMAASTPRSGSYAGSTSQHRLVTFRVTESSIRRFSTTLGSRCGHGQRLTLTAGRIRINSNGTFAKGVTLKLGATKHQPGRVSGRGSGSRISGTVAELAGGKPSRCYTETFTAHHV
jgi:hypothetical protein